MSDQYEEDQEDGVEFVGHYDRFFKNMSDPVIKSEVKEKEALIIQKIDAVRDHQLKMKAETRCSSFFNGVECYIT